MNALLCAAAARLPERRFGFGFCSEDRRGRCEFFPFLGGVCVGRCVLFTAGSGRDEKSPYVPRDFPLQRGRAEGREQSRSGAGSARAPFLRSGALQGSSGSGGLRGGSALWRRQPPGGLAVCGPCWGGRVPSWRSSWPGSLPAAVFRSLASNPGFVLRCRDSVYQMSQVWAHELQEFKGRGWPCFTGTAARLPVRVTAARRLLEVCACWGGNWESRYRCHICRSCWG